MAQFAVVDCTAEDAFIKKHSLTVFPTIRFYGAKRKEKAMIRTLPGWRSQIEPKSEQLVEFLRLTIGELYAKEIEELEQSEAGQHYRERLGPGFEDDFEPDLEPLLPTSTYRQLAGHAHCAGGEPPPHI